MLRVSWLLLLGFLILKVNARSELDDGYEPAEYRQGRALKKDLPPSIWKFDDVLGLHLASGPKVKRAGSSISSGKKGTNKKFVASLKSILYQGKEKSSSSRKSSKREGGNGATYRPTTPGPSSYPSALSAPLDPLATLFPSSITATSQPTKLPTGSPVVSPVSLPPTSRPTGQTIVATSSPTTSRPTSNPTGGPTNTEATAAPTAFPTVAPTTNTATGTPTSNPTVGPTTSTATVEPTVSPTVAPTTVTGTDAPTVTPTIGPTTSATTGVPTVSPTVAPTTGASTDTPTPSPTIGLTATTTESPTNAPTVSPTTLSPTTVNLDPFDITFTFVNTTTNDETLIRSSAARWESVMLSGEESASGVGVTSIFDFAEPLCTYPDEIDDLHICSGVFSAISDGVGGALAFGGAERTRANGVPFTGLMAFDPADQSSLDSTAVLHEMGHALGFGTLWSRSGFVGSANDGCPYTGTILNTAYSNLSGCGSSVLLEVLGTTPATCGFHLDESCFQNELMTPTFNSAQDNPLSVLTIAALEDIGYTVDYSAADEYTVDDLNAACVCRRREARNLRFSLPTSGRLLHSDVLSAQEFGRRILQQQSHGGELEQGAQIATSIAVLYRGEDGTIGSVITSI